MKKLNYVNISDFNNMFDSDITDINLNTVLLFGYFEEHFYISNNLRNSIIENRIDNFIFV